MMPPFVTVTRRLHPLEGQMLRVLGKMHRHGEEELLLVLGDGSKSLIPSAWTDFSGTRGRDDDAPEGTATLGRLEDLLWASELARGMAQYWGPREAGCTEATEQGGQPCNLRS